MSEADVVDFLRVQFARVHERLDGLDGKMSEVIQRVGMLELATSHLRRDVAALGEADALLSVRMDRVSERLDRIERRLGLIAAPVQPSGASGVSA